MRILSRIYQNLEEKFTWSKNRVLYDVHRDRRVARAQSRVN